MYSLTVVYNTISTERTKGPLPPGTAIDILWLFDRQSILLICLETEFFACLPVVIFKHVCCLANTTFVPFTPVAYISLSYNAAFIAFMILGATAVRKAIRCIKKMCKSVKKQTSVILREKSFEDDYK